MFTACDDAEKILVLRPEITCPDRTERSKEMYNDEIMLARYTTIGEYLVWIDLESYLFPKLVTTH